MVQRSTGEWQSETLPTRHKRREARWALQDASKCRLPIIGKPEIPLQTVGAAPPTEPRVTCWRAPLRTFQVSQHVHTRELSCDILGPRLETTHREDPC